MSSVQRFLLLLHCLGTFYADLLPSQGTLRFYLDWKSGGSLAMKVGTTSEDSLNRLPFLAHQKPPQRTQGILSYPRFK